MSVALRSWDSKIRSSASGCEEMDGGARSKVLELDEVFLGAEEGKSKSEVLSIIIGGAMLALLFEWIVNSQVVRT